MNERDEQRGWPWWVAVWAVMVRPVEAVRRTEGMGWKAAWVVHGVGMVLVVAVVRVLRAWSAGGRHETVGSVIGRARRSLDRSIASLDGLDDWVVLGLGAAAIELLAVLTPLMLMAWGAREETQADTILRSLHRVLRLTPFAAAAIAVTGAATIQTGHWASDFYYRPEMQWLLWFDVRAVPGLVACGGMLWGLMVLLRVFALGEEGARCCWPATCERCGYPLTGLVRVPACPECGAATRDSLDPERRTGSAWERWTSGAGGAVAEAWWTTAVFAVTRPRAFADGLRLWAGDRGHRSFPAVVVVLGWGVSLVGFMVGAWMQRQLWQVTTVQWFEMSARGAFGQGLVAASGIALSGLVGVVLTATLVGCGIKRNDGRTMMPGAMQAAAYASGVLVVGGALTWVVLLMGMIADAAGLLGPVFRMVPAPVPEPVVGLTALGCAWLAGGVYAGWVGVMTGRLKHANR